VYLVPPWEAPDELGHYGYVESLYRDRQFPVLGENLYVEKGFVQLGKVSAGKLPAGKLSSGQNIAIPANAGVNWIAQHPPLYYIILLPLFSLLPHQDVYLSIFFLRLVSILLGCLTLFLSFLTLQVLYPKKRLSNFAVVAGMAFLPGFSFISSLINNDNLVYTLSAALFYFMAKYWKAEKKNNYEIFLGIILGLLALTKVTSLPLWGAVFILIIIGWIGKNAGGSAEIKHDLKAGLFNLSVTIVKVFGLAIIICGAWYVRNLAIYGTLFPELVGVVQKHPELMDRFPDLSMIFPELVDAGKSSAPNFMKFIFEKNFLIEYYKNFWGGIGLPFRNLTLPQMIVIFSLTIFSLAGYLKAAIKKIINRENLIFLVPLILMSMAVSWKLYGIYLGRGLLGAMHGRYMYSVLLPFMFVFVRGLDYLFPSKWHTYVMVALVCFFVISDFISLNYIVLPEFY
jgi:hypothetical protein